MAAMKAKAGTPQAPHKMHEGQQKKRHSHKASAEKTSEQVLFF